ncbi:MAG: hypothetical protein ACJ8CB_15225 [Ktedonobacteraceae bacterium]
MQTTLLLSSNSRSTVGVLLLTLVAVEYSRLQERTDAHHILRADFARIFTHEGRRLDIFPGCPRISIAKDTRTGFSRFSQRSIRSCNI